MSAVENEGLFFTTIILPSGYLCDVNLLDFYELNQAVVWREAEKQKMKQQQR